MELVDVAIFLFVAVVYVHLNAHLRSPEDCGVVDARGLSAHELGDLFAGNQPAVHDWPHATGASSPLAVTKLPQTVLSSTDLRAAQAYRTFVRGPAEVTLAPYASVPDRAIRFDAATIRYYADPDAQSEKFHKVILEQGECLYVPPQWWYSTDASSLEYHSIISHLALLPEYGRHLLHVYGRKPATAPVVPNTKLNADSPALSPKLTPDERVSPNNARLRKGGLDAPP